MVKIQCQRRNTRQRQVVLEELRASFSHPTAGDLYRTVVARMPQISLGTVYRNLEILQESGQAIRLAGCTGQEARYDGRTDPHLHFQCCKCARISDLDTMLPLLDELVGTTVEGHEVTAYQVVLRGTCRACGSSR
ncbi:MAG TPA: transcriptional repressor [Candidatus Krumholzibacteria bacterium]|nr:transcriptional repressor [Candidatus Krumholzibacteria bacterium]HPD70479.1 transcriptional repressor [Candidatus Krumholzibacteria bacterium]HRY39821.1 transcriptional repressor [Candidatus Krumholzibacteria bacterium]